MDPKDRIEAREYNRGYNDAKEGKSANNGSDPGTFLITLGLAGGPRPGAESYRQGHEDGKEDRKR